MLLDVPTSSRIYDAPPVDVLIVEDEQTSRRVLARLLGSSGYRTESFRTAEDALSWIKASGCRPEFALVDLDLPGMSGLQFIDRLRSNSPETHPILVTATDEQTLARKTRGLGLPYLRKPLDFDRLLSKLNESVGR
jgi:two-component system, response regulator RegA